MHGPTGARVVGRNVFVMFRFALLLGAAATVLAAGCASSDDAIAPEESAVVATTVAPEVATPSTTVAPTTTAVPDEPQVVTVAVQVPELGVDAEVAADAEFDGDPFDEEFATCSAYREVAGVFAVGAGGPEAAVPWVSVVSAARIDGAGEVAADVRVDLPDGTELDATGVMTLDADLAAGSFSATTADGTLVEGSFECAGSQRPPVTMAVSDEGAIEVVALIERDGRQRIVTAATLDAEAADCPVDDELVVRVEGDATLGAISTFEITRDGDGVSLTLRVGGTAYEFDDVVLELDESAEVGTFVAIGDASVTGAFSCG